MCDLEDIGAQSIFKLIRSVAVFAKLFIMTRLEEIDRDLNRILIFYYEQAKTESGERYKEE